VTQVQIRWRLSWAGLPRPRGRVRCQNPASRLDLLFYARPSCSSVLSTCSWPGCSAGWCFWREVMPSRMRRSWCSGMRSRCCAVSHPPAAGLGNRAVMAALARLLPGCLRLKRDHPFNQPSGGKCAEGLLF